MCMSMNSAMNQQEESCSQLPDISISKPPKKYRSLAKNQCPLVCKICRGSAFGYHYEIASCNACKTFFRRTILLGKEYSCNKSNDCLNESAILNTGKRICRSCRFEKCVEVGMNPLAIQAEVKNEKGKEMQLEIAGKNRPIFNIEDRINGIIEELMMIEKNVEVLNNSGLPIGYRDMRRIEQVIDSKPCFDMQTQILSWVKIQPKCDPVTGIPLKPKWATYTHTSYLASIEYLKSFEFFELLDPSSKKTLVLHSTLMCSNMFNAYYTMQQHRSDRMLHPDGTLTGPAVVTDERGRQIAGIVQRTLIALLRNKLDRVEYILLKAMIMCNPAIPGLTPYCQSLIEKCRIKYTQSLFLFCRLEHGNLNGPARFSALVAIATVLENQQKDQKDFHIYMKALNFCRYEPFMDDPQSYIHDEKGTRIFDEIMEG